MTTSSQPAPRIFISHSHTDNAFGIRLVDDLRAVLGEESAVWYDERGGLHGGDPWWHKIMEELRARQVFIVVLSPEAVASHWVNAEIDLAWRQRLSPAGKQIIPLLYRQCQVRDDLDTLQILNFLPPKTYEEAFDELLLALGLHRQRSTSRPIAVAADPETLLVQQMTPQIEISFAAQDWLDVIRKTNFLLKRAPGALTSALYRLQGIALVEEGELPEAQEAFDTALALVSEREQRLIVLRDYADLLASQDRWNEVLRLANEALRLVPHDSDWVATQQLAQGKVKKVTPVVEKPKQHVPSERQRRRSSVPQKTKGQWLEEGDKFINLKQYSQALEANEQAIRLDPKYVLAYDRKAYILLGLKRYQEALETADQIIRLDPNNALAYDRKSFALERLGKKSEAN